MKKGFTLIELLAVIIILAVIALIATPIILGIISDSKKEAFKDTAYGIVDAAKYNYVNTMYNNETPVIITFTYTDGEETASVEGEVLNYEGGKPENGQVILNVTGEVALALYDGKYCATKRYTDVEVTVAETAEEDCTIPGMILVDDSGANAPVLATGMTAVMWDTNTSAWVAASDINDPYEQNWYDYGEKKWANAQTEDGSFWVWIPRYAYQITSNYHTSTTGTIGVKFLRGATNTANDSTTIYTDNASDTHYVKHPGFTFGSTEVTGIWVSKFEMSGTTSSLDSKPGADSLRNASLGSLFTAVRNMELNNKYGWTLAANLQADGTFTTDTNNVDTHMMKSIEWGAVAYLSISTYGKNGEINWNSSNSYTGGDTGNAYVTNVGQSSTGNIYGIYDMNGGSYVYVMGNYNNTAGSSGLTPANINAKYIDRYTAYSNTRYGDSIYETSSTSTGSNGWYGDYSTMIDGTNPWFKMGGALDAGAYAGAFSFFYSTGAAQSYNATYSVVLVGTGL